MRTPSPERLAAIAAGEPFYFTGKPCKAGHIAKRRVVNSACIECLRSASMRFYRRGEFADKPGQAEARERGERHFQGPPCPKGHTLRRTKTGECVACRINDVKEWRKRNPGYDATTKTREHRRKNPEKHRANVKRWKERNREKARAMLQRWKDANPERVRELSRIGVNNRRSREAANGGSFTAEDIAAILIEQDGHCAVCPTEDRLEIDHIHPVSRGGSSDPSNLQLLCLPCNRSKGSKTMEEWLL